MLKENKKTILIIDNIPTQDGLNKTLEVLFANNYLVLFSTDPQEAVNMVTIERPDIILLSVMMPQLNGCKIYDIIKNDISANKISVIFLIEESSTSDVLNDLDLGNIDLLMKPYKANSLLARLNNLDINSS